MGQYYLSWTLSDTRLLLAALELCLKLHRKLVRLCTKANMLISLNVT